MTIKPVRFVKVDSRNPVQDIAELALFDASGNTFDPSTLLADGSVTTTKLADYAVTASKIASGVLPANATKGKAGLVKQAAHVDPSSGTVAQVVNALISAGVMASS